MLLMIFNGAISILVDGPVDSIPDVSGSPMNSAGEMSSENGQEHGLPDLRRKREILIHTTWVSCFAVVLAMGLRTFLRMRLEHIEISWYRPL
jgi:hypothetical protein